MKRTIAITVLAATLGACATVPSALQGNFDKSTPRDALARVDGQTVRWGGQIINVEPKVSSTCFAIISRPLDASARPQREQEASGGRFIACHAGFFDPELYARGRDLTVVGRVSGTEVGKVGEFDYTYPVVEATSLHLWPKRPLYVNNPYYYDPWYMGPPGWRGYWGWSGWGPYWGPGPIIIRDHGQRPAPRPEPEPKGRP